MNSATADVLRGLGTEGLDFGFSSRAYRDITQSFLDLHESSAMQAVRAMENSSVTKLFKDMGNSPVERLLKDMENSPVERLLKGMENSPVQQLVNSMEESAVAKLFREPDDSAIRSALRAIDVSSAVKGLHLFEESAQMADLGVSDSISNMCAQVLRATNSSETIDRQLQAHQDHISSYAKELLAQLDGVAGMSAIREAQAALEASPVTHLVKRLIDSAGVGELGGAHCELTATEDVFSDLHAHEHYQAILEPVQAREGEPSTGRLNPELCYFILGVIVTIVLHVEDQTASGEQTYFLSQQHGVMQEATERRTETLSERIYTLQAVQDDRAGALSKRVQSLNEALSQHLEHSGHEDDDAQLYVVETALNLREGPGGNYPKIGLLPAKLLVRELGREQEWVHVEYFDPAVNSNQSGWVTHMYLLPVESPFK